MKSIKTFRQKIIMPNGKKMSQQNLADILKVSRSTVAMWETDGSEPDWSIIPQIAAALNVSVEALMLEEGKQEEKHFAEILKAHEKETQDVSEHGLEYTAFSLVKNMPEDLQKAAIEQLKTLASLAEK